MNTQEPLETDPEAVYRERLECWRDLHRRYGPARSYPHAWRLPELARPLGAEAQRRGYYAQGLDLLTLGRAGEALAVLAPLPWQDDPALSLLRLRCLALLGRPESFPDRLHLGLLPMDRAHLAWEAEDTAALSRVLPDLSSGPWRDLLGFWCWAQVNAGAAAEDAIRAAHRAAARLGQGDQTEAARAEACLAEGLHALNAAASVVWLEYALDRCETWGQHHLRWRLTRALAAALTAQGELGAAQRRERRLAELARRMQPATWSAP